MEREVKDLKGLNHDLFSFQSDEGANFLWSDNIWTMTQEQEKIHLFAAPDPEKIAYIKKKKNNNDDD